MNKAILLAALVLPAASLAAAEPAGAPASGPTPEEDIRCAVWASYIVGTSDDPAAKTGFGHAMNYFIGLYEGKTGKDFGEKMLEETVEISDNPAQLSELDDICGPRMNDLGSRLLTWSNAMEPTAGEAGQ